MVDELRRVIRKNEQDVSGSSVAISLWQPPTVGRVGTHRPTYGNPTSSSTSSVVLLQSLRSPPARLTAEQLNNRTTDQPKPTSVNFFEVSNKFVHANDLSVLTVSLQKILSAAKKKLEQKKKLLFYPRDAQLSLLIRYDMKQAAFSFYYIAIVSFALAESKSR